MTDSNPSPRDQLRRALDAGLIDQHTFDTAVAGMAATLTGQGAIAQGQNAQAVDAHGAGVGRDNFADINTGRQLSAADGAQVIYAEQGATVVIGDVPVAMTAVDRGSALGRYLQDLIAQSRYLQLQGIRSGGRVVNIELDRIYVSLRATPHHENRQLSEAAITD